MFAKELKNETEDYLDAPWEPTFEVESTASHKYYQLKWNDYTIAVVVHA